MSEKPRLPNDVLEAGHSNRKIDAVKLLRAHQDLGLKEAKHIIDAYVAENPQRIRRPPAVERSGFGRILLVGVVVAILYFAYRQLS